MSAIFLTIKKSFKNRGVTLVEMILYVVLLIFVMSIIVQMLVSVSGVYRNIKLTRELGSSGTVALDSILREVRNASSVKVSSSIFGTSPGAITVLGIDENLIPYEVAFSVASGTLLISRDGGVPIALTSHGSNVNYLLFTHLTSVNSEGVRIELEMSGTTGSVSKSEHFYGFTVLRGAY